MAMSLATTQMLGQQLGNLAMRQNYLQMKLDEIVGGTSDSGDPSSSGAGASDAGGGGIAARIETSVKNSLRASLAGDVREAVLRERRIVEDKIVQSVTAVSRDLDAKLATSDTSVRAVEEALKKNEEALKKNDDEAKKNEEAVKALGEAAKAAEAKISAIEAALLASEAARLASDNKTESLVKQIDELRQQIASLE